MSTKRIILTGEQVPLVLDGSQTQVCLPCRDQTPRDYRWVVDAPTTPKGKLYTGWVKDIGSLTLLVPTKPPYAPGDELWIAEPWRVGAWDCNNARIAVDYRADGFSDPTWCNVADEPFERLWVESTDDARTAGFGLDADGNYHWKHGESPCRRRPSTHMPQWAARSDRLRVTKVEPRRLETITPDECLRSGIESTQYYRDLEHYQEGGVGGDGPIGKMAFRDQWQTRHPKHPFDTAWAWRVALERTNQ